MTLAYSNGCRLAHGFTAKVPPTSFGPTAALGFQHVQLVYPYFPFSLDFFHFLILYQHKGSVEQDGGRSDVNLSDELLHA